MTTISIDLSTQDLLKGVEKLKDAELNEFVQKVLKIRAKRLADSLSQEETTLLEQINNGLTEKEHSTLLQLAKKSQEGQLNSGEHQSYLALSDKMEMLNAKRMSALVQLSTLRNVSLDELMEQLGLLEKVEN